MFTLLSKEYMLTDLGHMPALRKAFYMGSNGFSR
jgi:hypothetical protein